ncbi:MAG: NAD+ synthase [Elusimicrobia bacterium]|nr:NAD+ synthase [Elusimicrobiota bacterium]
MNINKGILRIACAQVNLTVGDIKGNLLKISEYIERAKSLKVDMLSFPELTITGYPPEDLIYKSGFIGMNMNCLKAVAEKTDGIKAIVGFIDNIDGRLYNAAAVLDDGHITAVYHKRKLPNYGVFDENRYFVPGEEPVTTLIKETRASIMICEDIWKTDFLTDHHISSVGIIVSLNASPYHMGKMKERESQVCGLAREYGVYISYCNLIGGQDELIFDGQSFIVNNRGDLIARAGAFREELLVAEIEPSLVPAEESRRPVKYSRRLDDIPEAYAALVCGVKDYMAKNEFKEAIIGLSGGIDSSLVTVIAADALGSSNVKCIYMPSMYSSEESFRDASALTAKLGVKLIEMPINSIYEKFIDALSPFFKGMSFDITEENIQARIRGSLLMALSNKFGYLVLTTGNKSEMSTGYATLYGDMAGGFAVIKDVPKTLVYKLSKYRNTLDPVIPENIFLKEPTAELRPGQKDSDTLPGYDLLDTILKAYIEENRGTVDIAGKGIDREIISRVAALVDKNEYKRRQSPPGIKITPLSFGKERRMPITNRYKDDNGCGG